MRISAENLVRQLTSRGYVARTFSLSSVGDYAVADADLNYKDVPHVNHVHASLRTVVGTCDDDVTTAVIQQKILGIPFLIALANYTSGEDSQTYFSTFGPYLLVVNSRFEALGENRTRVVTTYYVVGSRLMMLLFPVIRRALTKNFDMLMSEDIPIRERRGTLRARGFRFTTDGCPRSFLETMKVTATHVVPPERSARRTETLSLERLAAEGASLLVGEDDDRGLRLVRRGQEILAFPRVCAHEGAPLDCGRLRDGRVQCPWHGRLVAPLLRAPLDGSVTTRDGPYELAIEGDRLSVTLPDGAALRSVSIIRGVDADVHADR